MNTPYSLMAQIVGHRGLTIKVDPIAFSSLRYIQASH